MVIDATTGNLGVGTSSPSTKLDIVGQVKISGGSPGAGKVLTSDASGLATWQTPSGGSSEDNDWTVSGNDLYSQPSGNVGIGTSYPTSFKLQTAGSVGPDASDSYDLGSSTLRWKDLYLSSNSLHLGSDFNEATIGYNLIDNVLTFDRGVNISGDITSNGNIVASALSTSSYMLPGDPGAYGQVMTSDGFGGVFWQTPDGGSGGDDGDWVVLGDDMYTTVFGNVGIGNMAPMYPLHMGSGAYVSQGGVWTNASSRTLKENIFDLSLDDAISALKKIKPVTFNYKNQKDEQYAGFIAEDVPDLVAMNDRKSLSSMDIVAVLTKVLQEQQRINQEQQKEIDALKTQIDQLSSSKSDSGN